MASMPIGWRRNKKTAFSVKADGSARLQLQGDTNDSVVRKDYVDTVTKAAQDEVIKNLLNITNAIDSWESVQKIEKTKEKFLTKLNIIFFFFILIPI